jgi:hypothetical protein
MDTKTELLLDYQEMAILALREEVKRLTKERDFFFDKMQEYEHLQ